MSYMKTPNNSTKNNEITYSKLENYEFNVTSDDSELDRRFYRTELMLSIPSIRLIDQKMIFRVDTGSPYTIINMRDLVKFEKVYDDKTGKYVVMTENIRDKIIYDTLINLSTPFKDMDTATSKGEIKTRRIIVDDFKLTDKIIFPKLEIFISDSLRSTSILGMDILTLFKFTYVPSEKEITLASYPDYLKRFHSVMGDASKDCISPYCIALIDDADLYSEKEQENDASEPIQSAYSEKILSDAEVIEEVFRYPAADE